MAFIVPAGVTWSLPLYEIALMTQRRATERGADVKIAIITPESAPLAVFGPAASAAVSDLLRARHIEVFPSSTVRELGGKGIRLSPQDRALSPAEAVALSVMEGPAIDGLPANEKGFIPIDDHARVKGVEDVYAAGDGTNFPIKQGGLGTQQADAAAEDIAHRLGATGAAEPFRPVLRGKLITGDESLNLRADVAGGGGEGEASPDYLWWPPDKISARYLAPLLYHGEVHHEPDPPTRSLDVEVCTAEGVARAADDGRSERAAERRMSEAREYRGGQEPAVISRAGLDELLAALARRGFQVIGPTVRDQAIMYEEISSTADLPEGLTNEQEGGTYRLRERDDERPVRLQRRPQLLEEPPLPIHPHPLEGPQGRGRRDQLPAGGAGDAALRLHRGALLRSRRDRRAQAAARPGGELRWRSGRS